MTSRNSKVTRPDDGMSERDLATRHGLPELVPYDRCGAPSAVVSFVVAGSPRWLLKTADELGLSVHRREAIELLGTLPPRPGVDGFSQRAFHVCASCAGALQVEDRVGLIEPGYEDAVWGANDATRAVWDEWHALDESEHSPVKKIAAKLGMSTSLVASIVYPPHKFGPWDDSQEADR
jgi:hypothetical protein